jgi:cytochrome c-type biogenesis protein CcmH/NrfG
LVLTMRPRQSTQRQSSQGEQQGLYARFGLTPQAGDEEVEKAHEEIVGFLRGAPDGIGHWAHSEILALDEARARLAEPTPAPSRGNQRRSNSPLRRFAVGIVTLAVTVGVVIAVYNVGGGQSEPGSQQAAAGQQGLNPSDEAQVAELMKKLKADPKDAATLVALGNLYFQAGDFNTAGSWMEQAVTIESGNVKARLALGASLFNLGDAADAERHWLRVVAIEPKNVEAFYDLGFLYLSKNPPDMARAKQMWRKVIEIAPDSAVAKTVATHLKGLEKAGPGDATSPAEE